MNRVCNDDIITAAWKDFLAWMRDREPGFLGEEFPDNEELIAVDCGTPRAPLATNTIPAELRDACLVAVCAALGLVQLDDARVAFFGRYQFASRQHIRSLTTALATQPDDAVHRGTARPADAVLLCDKKEAFDDDIHKPASALNGKRLPWAEAIAVITVTPNNNSDQPRTFIMVRPVVALGRPNAVIDQRTSMPVVARGTAATSPLLAVDPLSIVQHVHLVADPASPPGISIEEVAHFVNWWILRSDFKYPVRHRDLMLGLRGHTVTPPPAASARR